MSSCPSKIMVC
uniref:Uncharacterized protein n=1 Tax=Arundo donax TaxID=35708 RepID=A0A0A9GL21_ARUDO